MTAEELLLDVARGLTLAGFWTLFLTVFDVMPERNRAAWVAWTALVFVSGSIWVGLGTRF